MFLSEGSTSYFFPLHVTTETEPAVETSCFTYEWKRDGIKKGIWFWNMIHHLQGPLTMISPFFVNTKAHCWVPIRDSKIMALRLCYSVLQYVTVCYCMLLYTWKPSCYKFVLTEDTDFGENVVVLYIAVTECADCLSGRQMVLMSISTNE